MIFLTSLGWQTLLGQLLTALSIYIDSFSLWLEIGLLRKSVQIQLCFFLYFTLDENMLTINSAQEWFPHVSGISPWVVWYLSDDEWASIVLSQSFSQKTKLLVSFCLFVCIFEGVQLVSPPFVTVVLYSSWPDFIVYMRISQSTSPFFLKSRWITNYLTCNDGINHWKNAHVLALKRNLGNKSFALWLHTIPFHQMIGMKNLGRKPGNRWQTLWSTIVRQHSCHNGKLRKKTVVWAQVF